MISKIKYPYQNAKKIKTITVCPICLKCFPDRDLARDHRIAFHHEGEKKVGEIFWMILLASCSCKFMHFI